MDDIVPAIVHDFSSDNIDTDGTSQNYSELKNDPNAAMDLNGNHYTVIDNEDDEYDDIDAQNKQEPNVVTWFTFYSHREQREYYYEPISGTTTWIAPSQTGYDTDDVKDDHAVDSNESHVASCSSNAVITNIISRLPGSPILHESIQNHMNHAITVSNQIHQNHILPIITKRPVAILLLLCNIGLFYMWLRSGKCCHLEIANLNTTSGLNATTTTNIPMIPMNTTDTILPITEDEIDNEVDESSWMMTSSKPLDPSRMDGTDHHNEMLIDAAGNTVVDNTGSHGNVDDRDDHAETDTDTITQTDEVLVNDRLLDSMPMEVIDVNDNEMNVVVEISDDKIDLTTGTLPLTLEPIVDSYEHPVGVNDGEVDVAPDTVQEAVAEHENNVSTVTKEQRNIVMAGTDREHILTTAVVSEPAKKLEIPDAIEPNILSTTKSDDVSSATIHEDSITVPSRPDVQSDTTENNTDATSVTSEVDILDHEEKTTVSSISPHELDRYEAIQKEAMMVVQRVGMNAINAGYMIELEPNVTTATSNITRNSNSALKAAYNTTK